MALKPPRSSAAAIHRRVGAVAKAQGWRVPTEVAEQLLASFEYTQRQHEAHLARLEGR